MHFFFFFLIERLYREKHSSLIALERAEQAGAIYGGGRFRLYKGDKVNK